MSRLKPPRSTDTESPRRRELILDMVRASATPLTVVAIADELGVHPNTVRFHLDALVDGERIERVVGEISGPGRPPIVYRPSQTMDRNGPSNYRLLATMLTSHLATTVPDPAATAIELGRTWGPGLIEQGPRRSATSKTEALTRVVGVLADMGFEPEPVLGPRAKEIRLRHCPFLDLVDDHADVICSVHLGLMQGALATLNTTVTVERLTPFAEPNLCIAHLASTTAAPS
jgi:predicted ArsR family transcriptional regulator